MTENRKLSPGGRILDYRLLEVLGEGGFGQVFRAEHEVLGRVVAIKVARDLEAVSALRTEAVLQSQLDHPGIVRTLEISVCHDPAYVVMEYVKGESLRKLIERGSLPVRRASQIALQICEALSHAHSRGVVHGDLKPGNVLIPSDDSLPARLTDFGLAKLVDSSGAAANLEISRSLTLAETASEISGTLRYIAPEVQRGEAPDPKADIYALGLLLFEMLTGVLPEGRELPSEVKRGVPSELDEVFSLCFVRKQRRIGSAVEVASRLRKVLGISDEAARAAQNLASPVSLVSLVSLVSPSSPAPSVEIALKDGSPAKGPTTLVAGLGTASQAAISQAESETVLDALPINAGTAEPLVWPPNPFGPAPQIPPRVKEPVAHEGLNRVSISEKGVVTTVRTECPVQGPAGEEWVNSLQRGLWRRTSEYMRNPLLMSKAPSILGGVGAMACSSIDGASPGFSTITQKSAAQKSATLDSLANSLASIDPRGFDVAFGVTLDGEPQHRIFAAAFSLVTADTARQFADRAAEVFETEKGLWEKEVTFVLVADEIWDREKVEWILRSFSSGWWRRRRAMLYCLAENRIYGREFGCEPTDNELKARFTAALMQAGHEFQLDRQRRQDLAEAAQQRSLRIGTMLTVFSTFCLIICGLGFQGAREASRSLKERVDDRSPPASPVFTLDRNTFDRNTFDRNTFDRNTFDRGTLNREEIDSLDFDRSVADLERRVSSSPSINELELQVLAALEAVRIGEPGAKQKLESLRQSLDARREEAEKARSSTRKPVIIELPERGPKFRD